MATAKKKATAPKAEKASVIATLAAEMKLDAKVARRRLRAAGMKAPYTDIGACRKALTVKE